MTEALTIRVHSSLDAAERDLETPGLAGYAFGRFAWLRAWYETIGIDAGVAVAVAVVADHAVRMVVPLGIVRQGGVRVLTFLGAPVTDYNAPLVEPGFAADTDASTIQILWERIRALLPPHDIVRLLSMPAHLDPPAGAGVTSVPNPFALLAGLSPGGTAQSLRLPESSAKLRRAMRSGFVSDTRRQLRRLAEIGPVSLRVADDEATRQDCVDTLKRMKSRRWRETQSRDAFADPAFAAFYDLMAHMTIPEGNIHGSMFTVGDVPIAVHLGLVYRHRFYYLMLGWEREGWQRFSPGRLMVDALIDLAIGDGRQVFDFTIGDESYKGEWVDTELPLSSLEVAGSWRGAAVLAVVRGLRKTRAEAKRIAWLRALVRRLAGRPPRPADTGRAA